MAKWKQIVSTAKVPSDIPSTFRLKNFACFLLLWSVRLPLQKMWVVIRAKPKQKSSCAESIPLHSGNLVAPQLQRWLCEDERDNVTRNLHLTAGLQLAGPDGAGQLRCTGYTRVGVPVRHLKGFSQGWHERLPRLQFLLMGSAAWSHMGEECSQGSEMTYADMVVLLIISEHVCMIFKRKKTESLWRPEIFYRYC